MAEDVNVAPCDFVLVVYWQSYDVRVLIRLNRGLAKWQTRNAVICKNINIDVFILIRVWLAGMLSFDLVVEIVPVCLEFVGVYCLMLSI
jgi:hypothetical protein